MYLSSWELNIVVPRMLFDRWSGQDYMRLFQERDRVFELSNVISNVLKVTISQHYSHPIRQSLLILYDAIQENDFDGIVLEAWSQLGGQYSDHFAKVIGVLANHLHESKHIFILVIPPPLYHG